VEENPMKKIILPITVLLLAFTATVVLAAPDQFLGDSSIYSGDTSSVKPNVLFLIDNSNVMNQSGQGKPYDPSKDYTYTGALYTKDYVYELTTQGGQANYGDAGLTIGSPVAQHSTVTCQPALYELQNYGATLSYLKKNGTGACNASQQSNFYTGNLLNFINYPSSKWQATHIYSVNDIVTPTSGSTSEYVCITAGTSGSTQPTWPTTAGSTVTDGTVVWQLAAKTWTAHTAYSAGDVVVPTTGGAMTYDCVTAGTSGGSQPSWPDGSTSTTVTDGTVVWKMRSILTIVQDTVKQVLSVMRDSVNAGLIVFGNNNSGGKIIKPVLDISSTTGSTNYTNLFSSINGLTTLNSNHEPVNEALWDSGVYFRGQNSSSTLKISSDNVSYPSPISYTCQYSYVVVLTPGNADENTQTKANNRLPTDLTHDNQIGLVDDAAAYNYNTDASSTLTGAQRVQTHIIQLITTEIPKLRKATEYGYGDYYNVFNANDLAKALIETMSNIVLEANTSFVAPVVPVSPENRTFSGSRVYMGFFKPITQSYWHGNLKKYGLSTANSLTDKNGSLATYTDLNGDGVDDIDGTLLPTGAINGTFRSSSISFWTPDSTHDAGAVESGGAGQILQGRVPSTRKICTNLLGNYTDLNASGNAFSTANASLTDSLLGVATTQRDNLINFIRGVDTYDDNGNGNSSENREWIFGDILHSRPLIVNYQTFSLAHEGDFSYNKSYIYVGGNDGMLHAIRDYDGSEAWAFIPDDMLGNLNYMTQTAHTYFVDSTPSAYIYDTGTAGTISTPDDKVIIIFGSRRGGGKDSAPTSGSYYALDVTDPEAPTMLWKINNQTAGFGELAETWSEPKLVKMKIGGADKIVAFVGAGYDNIHEDTRFGNTRLYSNASAVSPSDIGNGDTVSGGSTDVSALTNPKGRGVYAIEIATLNNGVPDFTHSGTKIWGYTYGTCTASSTAKCSTSMKFSVLSEITALDTDNDGYADRLYVGDVGGRIWRFDVGYSSTNDWDARRIFSLSPGAGRKFFYKPSAIMESNYAMLFIGSGDREHPLNRDTNQIDRFYALKDLGQTTPKMEGDLTDVTLDELQTSTDTSVIQGIMTSLNSSYGWFMMLPNTGEKVLASPTVFNKVAYFTTYTPNSTVSADPCNPGNLGIARLYALDYMTGKAALNYDLTNDTGSSTVIGPSDRSKNIGSGIPSGIVMLISPGGDLKALIGVGGVIAGENPKKGGSIRPLYWRQK
jgi:type IV pilus assembly protein PilY1